MEIAFYGDSLTAGTPGVSFFDILRERLPEHTLHNYGEPDDTAQSLYARIKQQDLLQPVDLTFLWIGTNDLPFKHSPIVTAYKWLRGKRWAQSPEVFRRQYMALLDLLCPVADQLITVPPLLNGEDVRSLRNQYLQRLSNIIRQLSSAHCEVKFLDVRREFVERLAAATPPPPAGRSAVQTALDVLVLRTEEQVDWVSQRRGLHLTLDGVHLNSRGAELVADAFMKVIEEVAEGEPAAGVGDTS